ncbi:MAG TPA: hypothetical protein P5337_08465 [Aestuariivirga sp.]|nr:hypothetical protein [Aestuariivirga sp.]
MANRLFISLLATAILAAPAAAQERQWSLDASGEDAYLVFGVPDSDDIGVSIWCPIQQGEVHVYLPETAENLGDGQKTAMTISTDDMSINVEAALDAGQDGGTSSVEATLPDDSPIFDSMLKADRFTIKVGSDETVFPLFEADLSGLMDLCRKN